MKELLNILIIGKGGRENALAATLLKSPRCRRLYAAPGPVEGAETTGINTMDFDAVARFVTENDIDMVIPGPEACVVRGVYDALTPLGVKVIAPDANCASLEGSKEFAKEFMIRHGIPSPRFMTVTADTVDEGESFLDSLEPPYVVKADGLAAGRGAYITENLGDAKDMLHDMLSGLFGESSQTVVLEEYVKGEECSVFLAVDGEDFIMLPTAKDYKRLDSSCFGINTAGLGSISPAPACDEEFMALTERLIINPTLRAFREEGMDYHGFLYIGLMRNTDGEPVVLEYNVRLGDPEAQVILPRISGDFVDMLEGIADRTLALKKIDVSPLCTAGIVMAAAGYPGVAETGDLITGIEAARESGCMVFEGAVSKAPDGSLTTDGGRILTVVAKAETAAVAASKALCGTELIHFDGAYFRKDIGS